MIQLCMALAFVCVVSSGAAPPSDDGELGLANVVRLTESDGASVCVLSINGQMLTDIRLENYEKAAVELEAMDPDLIVIEVECSDSEDAWAASQGWIDPRERGRFDDKQLMGIARLFRVRLKDIPQVVWVKDSAGLSTILVLAWDRIYMAPGARLTGAEAFLMQTGFAGVPDEEVRAKMTAAWVNRPIGIGKLGGRSADLMKSLVDPREYLSGTWKGKDVEWRGDMEGQFVLDGSDEYIPSFNAVIAEEFRISEATVASLEELLLLTDIREYHLVGEKVNVDLQKYREGWRRKYADAKRLWGDYGQFRGWATGEDLVAYLGKCKNTVISLIGIMQRYPAVEVRMKAEYGLTVEGLKQLRDELQDEILAAGQGGGRGGGGSGGGKLGGG
jgi:hypothetical protein